MGTIAKPAGAGKTEKLGLDSAASHLLEECRMVLPGIQALFGFQLIAVFNEGFSDKLSGGEQMLHLAALLLVAVAAALVMTPAAVHRYAGPMQVSERFVWLSTVVLLASMLPLALGLCLDVYLITRIVVDSKAAGAAVASALGVLYLFFWLILPKRHASQVP